MVAIRAGVSGNVTHVLRSWGKRETKADAASHLEKLGSGRHTEEVRREGQVLGALHGRGRMGLPVGS